MKQIVVDLELTQVNYRTPQIIQIGAVLINTKTFKVLDTFNMLARPEDNMDRVEGLGDINTPSGPSTVTKLTGITADMVENATPLADVLELWWSWVGEAGAGYRLLDWGGGDMAQLKEQSDVRGITIEKRINGLDLKQMFGPLRQMKEAKARGGLGNTLELFGLKFIGRQHDALDDALNTAYLYLHFLSMVEKTFFMQKQLGNTNFVEKEFKRAYEEIKSG